MVQYWLMVTMGTYRKSPPDYLGDPSPTIYELKTEGSQSEFASHIVAKALRCVLGFPYLLVNASKVVLMGSMVNVDFI